MPGFEPQSGQPVASDYTHSATTTPLRQSVALKTVISVPNEGQRTPEMLVFLWMFSVVPPRPVLGEAKLNHHTLLPCTLQFDIIHQPRINSPSQTCICRNQVCCTRLIYAMFKKVGESRLLWGGFLKIAVGRVAQSVSN